MSYCLMLNGDRDNLEPLLEVVEDDDPSFVVVVDIGVTTDVNHVVYIR